MVSALHINRHKFSSEVLQSEIPVVVELYGHGCFPCRQLGPIVDRLAAEFEGQIKFVKVNANQESALREYFDPVDLPALALVDHGKDEGIYLGDFDENEIRSRLNRWVNRGHDG